MKKIVKFNEFINNDNFINESEIREMIIKAERTPFSDFEYIANMELYKKVIELGKMVIPYLLERLDISGGIWDIGLIKLTGENKRTSMRYIIQERVDMWKNWGKENGY